MNYRFVIGLALIVLAIILGFGLTYQNARELHAHEREQIAELKKIRQVRLNRHEGRDKRMIVDICRHQNVVQAFLHLPLTNCQLLVKKPLDP